MQLWALTDHDEIRGQHRAAAAAQALGMDYLTGVEISVTFVDTTVHIVGLGFDADDAQLARGHNRHARRAQRRERKSARSWPAMGIRGAYEGCAVLCVDNPELISRTHFARYLVDTGHCRDAGEVFRKYLTEGKPGFVPHRWARLGRCRALDTRGRRHGGDRPPGALPPDGERGICAVLRFQQHGGQGVEVVTGSHTAAEYATYAAMAQSSAWPHRIARQRLSQPGRSHTDLGALPGLPAS